MSTARVAHAPPVFRTGAFRTNSVTNPRDVSPEPRALNARREREKSSPRSCGREQLPRIDLRNLGLFTALG